MTTILSSSPAGASGVPAPASGTPPVSGAAALPLADPSAGFGVALQDALVASTGTPDPSSKVIPGVAPAMSTGPSGTGSSSIGTTAGPGPAPAAASAPAAAPALAPGPATSMAPAPAPPPAPATAQTPTPSPSPPPPGRTAEPVPLLPDPSAATVSAPATAAGAPVALSAPTPTTRRDTTRRDAGAAPHSEIALPGLTGLPLTSPWSVLTPPTPAGPPPVTVSAAVLSADGPSARSAQLSSGEPARVSPPQPLSVPAVPLPAPDSLIHPVSGVGRSAARAEPIPPAWDAMAAPAPASPVIVGSAPAPASAPAPIPAAGPPAVPLQSQLTPPILSLARQENGDHTVVVRVAPDDLGPVTVHARFSDTAVHIELFAPSDAGRDALRQILTELRRDLNSATGNASISVSDQNTPGADTSGRQHTPWTSGSTDRATSAIDQLEEPASAAPGTPRPSAIQSPHTLDVLV